MTKLCFCSLGEEAPRCRQQGRHQGAFTRPARRNRPCLLFRVRNLYCHEDILAVTLSFSPACPFAVSLGAKGHGCTIDACRVGHKKAENIETLFQLYDMLEADCQDTLKGGRTVPSKEAATATQLLDELRNRFVRLVRSQLTCFPAHTDTLHLRAREREVSFNRREHTSTFLLN